MASVFVTGGTGRMGHYVVKSLVDAGHKVTVLARESHMQIKGCKIVHGLISDFDYKAAKGCDWAVHMAGLVDMSKGEDEMFVSNVDGTRAVLERCEDAGVDNFLYMSSISVYGKRDNARITENTPARPDTPYARSKHQAELLTRNYVGNVCILRPAMVFGEGFDDGFRMAHRMIGQNKLPLIGRGDNVIPLVHAEDVAKSVCASVKENAAGVYNVCNTELMTQKELFTLVAHELKAREEFASIPRPLAKPVLSLFNISRGLQGKPPVPNEFIEMLATNRGVDASKSAKELGVKYGNLQRQLKIFVHYLSSK